jgi:Amt family ammonium transporter
VVAVNTAIAAGFGATVAMFYVMKRMGKPDPGMMVNGMLAGLVAITAPCAFVQPWAAAVIGSIDAVLIVEAVFFFERKGIDDPVGAISVHGVNGAWGVLSLGLFADGAYGDGWNGVPGTVRGLFYGDASQFAAQCVGTLTCMVFVFVSFFVFFKVVDALIGNRVSAETELEGLDIPEMGALAYPDFVLGPGTPMGGMAAVAPSKSAVGAPALTPARVEQ